VIPGYSAVLRVGLMILVAVVFQISCLVQIRVLGGIADITPLLIAAVALYAGSVPGAATGFFTGLLLDLALGTSLGASSLVLTAVGYGVGRYREQRDPSHGLTPIPVAAAATAGYVLAYAAVSFMLSIDAPVSLLVVREMLMTVLLNALIAMPFFAVSRRVLRPVLLVEPGPRARRDSTVSSGPIGLRGLEV
jgi:rod shape-determining protein MreD